MPPLSELLMSTPSHEALPYRNLTCGRVCSSAGGGRRRARHAVGPPRPSTAVLTVNSIRAPVRRAPEVATRLAVRGAAESHAAGVRPRGVAEGPDGRLLRARLHAPKLTGLPERRKRVAGSPRSSRSSRRAGRRSAIATHSPCCHGSGGRDRSGRPAGSGRPRPAPRRTCRR